MKRPILGRSVLIIVVHMSPITSDVVTGISVTQFIGHIPWFGASQLFGILKKTYSSGIGHITSLPLQTHPSSESFQLKICVSYVPNPTTRVTHSFFRCLHPILGRWVIFLILYAKIFFFHIYDCIYAVL